MSHTLEEQIDFMQSLMKEYGDKIEDNTIERYKLSQSTLDTLVGLYQRRENAELSAGTIRQYVIVTITHGENVWYRVAHTYNY